MIGNVVLLAVSALTAYFVFRPRVLRSRSWRATVTPLASIIGSGFLVAGPILADAYGQRAWIAMLALCGTGYLYGAAMRHNIQFVEPDIGQLPPVAATIERASRIMLSLAYFVSVAYYLNLFAAFGLRGFGVENEMMTRIVASVTIGIAGAVGLVGGLKWLERVEIVAVGLKLSVIAGVIAALAAYAAMSHDVWESVERAHGFEQVQVLLGLVILVQGFETSRYLGGEYSSKTRIRTMRHAQLLSTGIYVVFVFLVTHLAHTELPDTGGETEIIDMLRPIGAAAAPLLILAALASQSSAAVADMNGASGLLAETSRQRLSLNAGNLATALVAIVVTWSGNIYEIITYASKAFVGYYALQSLQAALSAFRRGRILEASLFAVGVLLAIAVVVLGKPAAA